MKQFFTLLLLGHFIWNLQAQSSDPCPRPGAPYEYLYAGVDIGATGIKPVVFQIEKLSDGKVIFRKISSGLDADNTFDLRKDRSPQTLVCLAKRLAEFVAVFQCPLYRVPTQRIHFVLSSGFVNNFSGDPYVFEDVKSIIRQYNPGITLEELTATQESEYVVRAVTMDGVLHEPDINIVDIGGNTLKGGWITGTEVKGFSTSTGSSAMAKEIEKAVTDNGWQINNVNDRRRISDYVAKTFREKYLPQVKINPLKNNMVVFGGGIAYMYTTWINAQDVANKTFVEFFFSNADAEYFVQQVINYPDNATLFNKGSGKNTIINHFGSRCYDNAVKDVYNGLKLLAGATILRELVLDFRNKKNTNQFIFNTDMMYSHLYYHIYLKSKSEP